MNVVSTNNSQQNNTKSVNTFIKSFYSDLSCMSISYWDEKISLRLSPIQLVNEDGTRQYDHGKRITTAITFDKCLALCKRIDEVIRPAMKAVESGVVLTTPVNTGFFVGAKKNNGLFIEYKNNTKGIPSLFLTVYTGVLTDGTAPKEGSISYEFVKTTIIENYNPETGSGDKKEINGEFEFFYDKLKSIPKLFGANHTTAMAGDDNKPATGYNPQQVQNYVFPQQQPAPYIAPVSAFDGSTFPFNN